MVKSGCYFLFTIDHGVDDPLSFIYKKNHSAAYKEWVENGNEGRLDAFFDRVWLVRRILLLTKLAKDIQKIVWIVFSYSFHGQFVYTDSSHSTLTTVSCLTHCFRR